MDKTVLNNISYGLYIIGSVKNGSINGMVSNTVMQVSADPAVIAVCINKKSLTNEYIKAGSVFTVNVLQKSVPMKLIGVFGFSSGREINKFDGIKYRTGKTGAPILLENSVCYMEATVTDSIEVETHTVFFGKVIEGEILSREEPITYSYYHRIKMGFEPPEAPGYMKKTIVSENKTPDTNGDKKLKKYICTVCGYVYDPAEGDPDSGIAPGTAFEDIPNDWVCPVCGVGKDMFEEA